MEYENIPRSKDILEEILNNDFYILPANTHINIRIDTDTQKKSPLINRFIETIGYIRETSQNNSLYLKDISPKEGILIGRIRSIDSHTREIGYSLTSMNIVNITKEYREW